MNYWIFEIIEQKRLKSKNFKRKQNYPSIMGWVQTVSEKDFVCFENNKSSLNVRIESRKTEDGWIIYRSYYSPNGINHTEEFEASTYDKMKQIIQTLQKERQPTQSDIRKLMIEKSRKISVRIERDFKEYNVEKWKFGVNKDSLINFALVRTYDEVDIDFIIHDSYKTQEKTIIKELISMLGFDGMEDVINIRCYYFTRFGSQKIENPFAEESQLDFL